MKKTIRRCLSLVLAVLLALGCSATAFAADSGSGITTVRVNVTYGQTEARGMLELVNDFRTGDEAWYWKPGNEEKKVLTNLKEMTYDYTLERIAMQRAAELALNFQHTRPNGTSCTTAFTAVVDRWSGYGENIAIGYTTAEAAFTAWQETNRLYPNQGHRINMLSGYNAIGIGHVVYNGVHYWVQEFAAVPSVNTNATAANDSAATVSVDVADSMITSVTLAQPDPLELEVGGSVSLPEVEANLMLEDSRTRDNLVTAIPDWSVSPEGMVTLSDGTLTAKEVGTATLTASVLGRTLTIPVNVTPISLSGATVALDQDSYSYTGEAITPEAVVTLKGVTLTEGTDYTLTYENNREEGTATVTVTGTGSYTGSVTKEFAIVPCAHEWGEGTVIAQPTCTAEGSIRYTCGKCGTSRTDALAMVPHTPVTDPAVAPTCAGTGLTEGSHCEACGAVLAAQETVAKLPHDYEASVIAEATCTADGEKKFVCATCGDTYTETIPATGHSFGEWTVVESPTCTEGGVEQRACAACGYTESRGMDAAGHDWAAEYTVDRAATCTEDGSRSIHCANCDAVKDAEVIPATGHSWDGGVVTAEAACATAGERRYTCQTCGAARTEVIPATGHDWDEGAVTTESTCTADGERRYTCRTCGETKTEVIPAGHDFTEWTVTGAAACTTDGAREHECRACGLVETETIPAPGHDLTLVAAQPASHTASGNIVHYVCAVCGGRFADEDCAGSLDAKDVILPRQPHTFAAGWSSDADGHWRECTAGDGGSSDRFDHTFSDWVVTTAPTESAAGLRIRACTVCGYQETEELSPVPATPGQSGSTGGSVPAETVPTEPAMPDPTVPPAADTTTIVGGPVTVTGPAPDSAGTAENSNSSQPAVKASTAESGAYASPQTGDQTPVVILSAVLVGASAALALLIILSKRRAK